MDLYTVVTFYQREPHTKPVVHSYGPYTRSESGNVARKLRRTYINTPGTFHVATTKVLHIADETNMRPTLKGA